MEDEVLNTYLRYFYYNLLKSDQTPYSLSSLVCIRAATYRYLQLHSQRKQNIIEGRCNLLHILGNYLIVICAPLRDQFKSSNLVLKYKVKEFINSGGQSRNYVLIEEADMNKIRKHFDRTTAQKIQDGVIFAILLAFGERGQEHLKSLMHRECL